MQEQDSRSLVQFRKGKYGLLKASNLYLTAIHTQDSDPFFLQTLDNRRIWVLGACGSCMLVIAGILRACREATARYLLSSKMLYGASR